MDDPKQRGFERLAMLVAEDAGAPAFAALAESHRRAGEPARARAVAEAGLAKRPEESLGRVALALSLIELGDLADATRELARVFDDHPEWGEALAPAAAAEVLPTADPLDDAEIDRALDDAEAQRDEMVDANQLAAHAMHEAELDEPEPEFHVNAPFATETMASLLEQQGDTRAAAELRAGLGRESLPVAMETIDAAESWPGEVSAPPAESDPNTVTDPKRLQIVTTLETWLHNIRRGEA